MKNKRRLLVDADIVVFQYACVNQQEYVWDEDVTSEILTLDEALEGLELFIEGIKQDTETKESPLFCFSAPLNFRYAVLPTYKHNRKDKEKPKLLEDLKQYIADKYETKTKPRLEADDVLGILATLHPDRYIIATLDKDLQQIPGWHYNWRTGILDTVEPLEGDYFFYKQILTGDPTDGYKGCPGIGEKRSSRLLEGVDLEKDGWSVVVEAYEKKGLTEEDALQQARVARILRETDYDFKNQEPILWTP